jgi:hypothetical protein
MDRDTPIARLVPYAPEGEPLTIRQPMGKYPSLQSVPLPPPVQLPMDVVSLLLEERQVER